MQKMVCLTSESAIGQANSTQNKSPTSGFLTPSCELLTATTTCLLEDPTFNTLFHSPFLFDFFVGSSSQTFTQPVRSYCGSHFDILIANVGLANHDIFTSFTHIEPHYPVPVSGTSISTLLLALTYSNITNIPHNDRFNSAFRLRPRPTGRGSFIHQAQFGVKISHHRCHRHLLLHIGAERILPRNPRPGWGPIHLWNDDVLESLAPSR